MVVANLTFLQQGGYLPKLAGPRSPACVNMTHSGVTSSGVQNEVDITLIHIDQGQCMEFFLLQLKLSWVKLLEHGVHMQIHARSKLP